MSEKPFVASSVQSTVFIPFAFKEKQRNEASCRGWWMRGYLGRLFPPGFPERVVVMLLR